MKNYIKRLWQMNNPPVRKIVLPDPGPNRVLVSPDGINWFILKI